MSEHDVKFMGSPLIRSFAALVAEETAKIQVEIEQLLAQCTLDGGIGAKAKILGEYGFKVKVDPPTDDGKLRVNVNVKLPPTDYIAVIVPPTVLLPRYTQSYEMKPCLACSRDTDFLFHRTQDESFSCCKICLRNHLEFEPIEGTNDYRKGDQFLQGDRPPEVVDSGFRYKPWWMYEGSPRVYIDNL